MSELTDEQLRDWRANWIRAKWGNPIAVEVFDELLALRARVAQLEESLCKISTACRKDTSLSPKDPLLDFVVGVVDAALAQPS